VEAVDNYVALRVFAAVCLVAGVVTVFAAVVIFLVSVLRAF
jgi:hypothetical protein